MPLKLEFEKLKELMKDFFILTGIRMCVFDEEYKEILAYPEKKSGFCALMENHIKALDNCIKSNLASFEKCKKTGLLTVYKCHAGLVEATAPLKENGIIIGYIMFGQIVDTKYKKQSVKNIINACKNYNIDSDALTVSIKKIKYKSQKQISAAAKILDACTHYILFKQIVTSNKELLMHKMNKYIDEHLEDEITVCSLCDVLNISRTRLYEISKQYINCGIASYIKSKRIEKAKFLLKNTDKTTSEISYLVGFSDYNYFCRVFKKEVGLSPKKFKACSSY